MENDEIPPQTKSKPRRIVVKRVKTGLFHPVFTHTILEEGKLNTYKVIGTGKSAAERVNLARI